MLLYSLLEVLKMKCTQCDSQELIHRKGIPFSVERSHEPNVRIEHYICTKCGHIEWFDMGFLGKYKENQSLIIEKQGEVLEVDKEIAQQLENIKNIKSDFSTIENRIKDDSSSKKIANEIKEKLNVIKSQLSELERKVYILNVRKSNIMKDIERIEGSLR